jgi:predicted metal-dependent hydrolase
VKRAKKPFPAKIVRQVADGSGTLTVEITRDRRLQKSVRWLLKQETILVRAPEHIPPRDLDHLVDDIIERVRKQRARARKQKDEALEQRAREINRKYFGGELRWHTIRWVSNMTRRLGSCTEGGTTDGDIRISDRIRPWPSYVVDYIVAHELAHRKYPNHSPEFWAYLSRYPDVERARGFIEGVAYTSGDDPDSLI